MTVNDPGPLTNIQCRMARAGLRWTASELADRAGVGVRTITRFESETSTPILSSMRAIRMAFEAAGVEFLEDDGIRIRRSDGELSPPAEMARAG